MISDVENIQIQPWKIPNLFRKKKLNLRFLFLMGMLYACISSNMRKLFFPSPGAIRSPVSGIYQNRSSLPMSLDD